MEEKEGSAKKLNSELAQTMKTLFIVLDGEEDSKGFFFQDSLEVHIFNACGTPEEIESLAKTCGTPIMLGILEPSKEDPEDPEREYVIVGLSFKGKEVHVYTGPGGIEEKFIMGIGKDYPDELIYLAIEANPNIEYVITSTPQLPGDDSLEIYINREIDVIALCN